MTDKVQVDHIRGAPATALMVLEPKAFHAEKVPREDWLLDFSKARDICERLSDAEARTEASSALMRMMTSSVFLVVRAKSFEDLLDKYLAELDDPVVVHFGCGLSDRCERYKSRIDAGLPFYDVDFPDMIALRHEFYEERTNYAMIGSDLSQHAWIEQLEPDHRARPFIFVAEGLTPYLSEAQLQDLFSTLKAQFPGCIFIFDTYSKLKIKSSQKVVAKYGVEMQFTNEDPAEIQAWGRDGEYVFLEEDNLLLRDDFLNNKYLPRISKFLMRMFARRFSWHKGITRSAVVLVFRLGTRAP
ncbi:Leucine carboxyl methyltransferase [Enhygromyxa salina]|uniref:Leucine carboxyl methyltransferase n=1 Tax=Enhygromyxa salina TaxID=215803 RepID=A0A2S9YFF8_9BACT|nr:class I SAM-dependent methyltransferase [Enhygromyxa salina]PRQ03843.1 Leucine carboxyl methyltransferase [Enhygromyxa salina]